MIKSGDGSAELRQVPALVGDVILDEEAKGDRRFVCHDAFRSQAILGNTVNDGHENFVL